MRWMLLALALPLAACSSDQWWEYPTLVCHERDVVSGKCLRSEYVCVAPLKLVPFRGGVICSTREEK